MIIHNRTFYTVIAFLATLYDGVKDTHRNQCVHYVIDRVLHACNAQCHDNWDYKKIDGDTLRFILKIIDGLENEFTGEYHSGLCSSGYMCETNTIKQLVEQQFFPMRNKSNG